MHALSQIGLQVAVVTAVWIKAEYEYSSGVFSPYLWCLIVLGYVMPMCGNFAFFIPEHYFVEELVVRMYDDDFEYTEKSCLSKWSSPFLSPFLILFSMCYCVLPLSFVAFCVITYDSDGSTTPLILDGSVTWTIYYSVTVFFVMLVNLRIFLITSLWIVVFCVVIVVGPIILIGAAVSLVFAIPVLVVIAALVLVFLVVFGVGILLPPAT